MARRRLDEELVAQGFFRSCDDAKRAIMAGEVSGSSMRYESAGTQVTPGCTLHVKSTKPYVSRGGLKLECGLDTFGVNPQGLRCLDVGCSTGGFTDCLLMRGAASVLAVDVGYAQFDWSLRQDMRVELLERTNIVDAATPNRRSSIDLAVCDVSFTSVITILPAVCNLLTETGAFLTLVKPQFEAERDEVDDGGIVNNPRVRAAAIRKVADAFAGCGLAPQAACASPITGAKGNHEYLLLGVKDKTPHMIDYEAIVSGSHAKL